MTSAADYAVMKKIKRNEAEKFIIFANITAKIKYDKKHKSFIFRNRRRNVFTITSKLHNFWNHQQKTQATKKFCFSNQTENRIFNL